MKRHTFGILGLVLFVTSVATATAGGRALPPPPCPENWKDSAMTGLLASAETVLKAKSMVESGRPIFGEVTCRVVSETPGNPSGDRYPSRVEEFTFVVYASFGDALARIAKLTITQTTVRFPRAPNIDYAAKVEPFPIGE